MRCHLFFLFSRYCCCLLSVVVIDFLDSLLLLIFYYQSLDDCFSLSLVFSNTIKYYAYGIITVVIASIGSLHRRRISSTLCSCPLSIINDCFRDHIDFFVLVYCLSRWIRIDYFAFLSRVTSSSPHSFKLYSDGLSILTLLLWSPHCCCSFSLLHYCYWWY